MATEEDIFRMYKIADKRGRVELMLEHYIEFESVLDYYYGWRNF